jgi:putative zinc finger/helix-turn-helix YgiT family protein
MICLKCDNEAFELQPDAVIEQEFRGESLKVKSPAMACTKCGWLALAEGQADELRKRTADEYRRRHGRLTSDEIREWRRVLGKSQREFAQLIGVGEASVKRWETWLVQDQSSDLLIRLVCEREMRRKTLHSWIESAPAWTQMCESWAVFCAPHHSSQWKPGKLLAEAFWGELAESAEVWHTQCVPSISISIEGARSRTGGKATSKYERRAEPIENDTDLPIAA